MVTWVTACGVSLFVSHPRPTAEDVGDPEHLADRINLNKFNVIKIILQVFSKYYGIRLEIREH